MDDISRGTATAALTLQLVVLQTLVHKGVITRKDALGIVDRSLEAAANVPSSRAARRITEITRDCLSGMREGLADISERL
jgi:hypothetical protein